MRAFTLIESLLVVALISILIAVAAASYTRIRWTAKVMHHASENRGRLNQAVSDGKFRTQKQFDAEQVRIKRQTEIGLTQGR
jgi:prepilin-type N-terminal cleavage/methylation domain-containing protein